MLHTGVVRKQRYFKKRAKDEENAQRLGIYFVSWGITIKRT
jgi:hypothetical protein